MSTEFYDMMMDALRAAKAEAEERAKNPCRSKGFYILVCDQNCPRCSDEDGDMFHIRTANDDEPEMSFFTVDDLMDEIHRRVDNAAPECVSRAEAN